MTTAPTIRINDIVIHDGEEWTVDSVRSQYDGRALVAELRWWSGSHRGREHSVCFWRADGEIRPLAWSPDGTLTPTGRHVTLRDGIRLVEISDADIAALRSTAAEHDDIAQRIMCDIALDGEDSLYDADMLDEDGRPDYSGGGHSPRELAAIRRALRMTQDEARVECARALAAGRSR